MEDLGVNNGDRAIFTHTKLPTATYAKLKPVSGDYLQWTNKKAVLEATLTNFATLSVGNTIVIDFNGKEYQFDVIDLKPSNAVCIINSDVEVDFVEEAKGEQFMISEDNYNNNINNDNNNNNIIETKNEEPEEIIPNNSNYSNPKLNEKDGHSNIPKRREREKPVSTPVKSNLFSGQGFSLQGDNSTPSPATSNNNIINNNNNNNDDEIRRKRLNINNINRITISDDNDKPKINNNDNNNNNNNNDSNIKSNALQSVNIIESKEEEVPADSVICKNCGKPIPKASALLHEPYCYRNNYKCPKCNLVMNKSLKDQHEEEFHVEVPCDLCSELFPRPKLADHILICPKQQIKCNYCELDFLLTDIEDHLASCPKQKAKCNYCELNFYITEIDEHTALCGSRTEKCEACGKYILLRDFELHFTSNCTYPSSNETVPSWEKNALRKSLIFCEDCFAPFYEFEDYQMHLAMQLDQLNTILTTSNTTFEEIFTVVSHKNLLEALDQSNIFVLVSKMIESFPEKDGEQAVEKLGNFLQQHQIDLKATSEDSKENYLHVIGRAGKKDLMQLFLNAGIKITDVDVDGNTPFHAAAMHGKDDCLTVLGAADVNVVNYLGFTALDLAIDQMHESTMKWLITNNGHFGNSEIGDDKCEGAINAIAEVLTLCALGFLPNVNQVINNITNLLQFFSETQLDKLRPRFIQSYNEYDDSRELYGGISPMSVDRERNRFSSLKVFNSGALKFQMIFHFPKDSGISIQENFKKISKVCFFFRVLV